MLAQMGQAAHPKDRVRITRIISECQCDFLIHDELKKLNSRQWHERMNAIAYLPFIAPAELIAKSILHALKDEFLDIRLAAALSLAEIGNPSAIDEILNALAVQGNWPVQRLIEIIEYFDDRAIPYLEKYLETPTKNEAALQVVIAVLGRKLSKSSISKLLPYSQAPNLETRIAVYRALGEIGGDLGLPCLMKGLKDSRWEIRAASAKALKSFSRKEVISSLQQGLTDSAWWVRFNCATTLSQLGLGGIEALEESSNSPDRFAADVSRMILDRNLAKVAA